MAVDLCLSSIPFLIFGLEILAYLLEFSTADTADVTFVSSLAPIQLSMWSIVLATLAVSDEWLIQALE